MKSTRYTICTLAIMLLSAMAARGNNHEKPQPLRDSVTYTASLYFGFDQSSQIDSMNYLDMGTLIFRARRYKSSPITITGWADKTGNLQYNKMLSLRRAATAKRYLKKYEIDESRINYTGMGVDSTLSPTQARRALISITVPARVTRRLTCTTAPETHQREIAPTPETEQPAQKEQQTPTVEQATLAPTLPLEKGKLSLRTNLLYWLGASINAGIEWNPKNTPLGVILNGGYAPIGGNHWQRSIGGWFVSPELRMYLGKREQWFVGTQMLYGGYNYKPGNDGYQGNVIAGGITAGYKIELSKCFDMDFSLGGGYGKFTYDNYFHEDGTNYRTTHNRRKYRWMPTQAGVSLIWKIR